MSSYHSLASFYEGKLSELHTHNFVIFMCYLQLSDIGLQYITCKTPIKTPFSDFWTSC